MANRKMTLLKTKTARSVLKQVGFSAALLVASSNASALGLGGLEVQSNLDQPLNGTIELRTSAGDDVRSVRAVIAPREDFERLGIDYPTYLENLSLSVEDSSDSGNKVLRVRSNGVIINEPFIHFLVRVEWSGGSFLREYTALIDPPVYAAEAPKVLAEPRTVGTDQSYQDSPIEVEPLDTPEETYDDTVSEATEVEEPDLATSEADETLIDDDFYEDEAASTETDDSVTPEDEGATYGPVASGESLSVIAQELQGQFPDLSIYSIMQVMFEENPNAFINSNINGLIQGSVLEIGDLSTILATDAQAAKEFFRAQLEEWDPSVLASSGEDSINVGQDEYSYSADDSDEDSGIDFGDSSGDSFQVGASDAEDDFISSDQGDSSEGELLAMRDQVTELRTSLASSEAEKVELKERISMLEARVADLNSLVELENAELAQVQDGLAGQDAVDDGGSAIDEFLSEGTDDVEGLIDDSVESVDDTLSGVDEFIDDAGDAVDDTLAGAQEGVDEFLSDADEGVDSVDDLLDEFVTDTGDGEVQYDEDGVEIVSDGDSPQYDEDGVEIVSDSADGLTDGVDGFTDDVVDEVSEEVVTPSIQIEKPQSFVEKAKSMIFEGGLWKVLAGLGGLLVAGLVFLFFRRRRADEEFEISMLSIESNSQSINTSQSSHSQSASISTSVASVAETVPDKETSFLTVYSDSDAVVQADEVDPVAEADVYIAYGRDEQAEEVLLDGIASNPDRIDIKHKLLSLYHKTENSEGFERVAEELYSQREVLTPEVWEEVSKMGKDVAPDNPLFDLSVGDLSAAAASSAAVDTDQAVDAVTSEAADAAQEAAEKVESTLDEQDSVSLVNFEDGRSEISELDEVEIDALNVDADTIDADLDSEVIEFNDTVLDEATVAADDESSVLEITLDDDADLEFDTALSDDDDGEQSIRDVSEVSDLEIDPDYDEARTQYELAKVFVDLGDEDGARKILNELVANEDNDKTVISDAQKLLDSIGS